jgi:ABC-type metal ion transport system substrate-binding protein
MPRSLFPGSHQSEQEPHHPQGGRIDHIERENSPFYTLLDIKDNPKKLKFIEAEITQTARSIQDVDAIIATAYFMAETAKADPKVFLFEDPQNKDFPLGLVGAMRM